MTIAHRRYQGLLGLLSWKSLPFSRKYSPLNGINEESSANVKGVTKKKPNLTQLQLAELVYAVNYKENRDQRCLDS